MNLQVQNQLTQVIPALRRLRQDDHHKFKASLGYKMDTVSEGKKTNLRRGRDRQTER